MQFDAEPVTAITSFRGFLAEPIAPDQRERLLRFSLSNQDNMLLPLAQLVEVLNVDASTVLAIPEMPRCVLGIYNWRGTMLWVVDLNQFVGYPSPFRRDSFQYPITIIVTQSGQQTAGLAVAGVHEIERHQVQQLHPPPLGMFQPGLLPFIRGTLPGSSDAVLDLQPLFHSPLWKRHPTGEA